MDGLVIEKLKVKQLKKELQKRGLDKRGVKEVLAKRLADAINNERTIVEDLQNEKEQIHDDLKDKNPNDNDLLMKIFQVVSDMNKRLRALENKFADNMSIISNHINAKEYLIGNLNNERNNLQAISAELISKESTESESPSKTTEETFIATIPTSNRFEVLERKTKQNIAKPAMTSEEQLAEYKRRHAEATAKQSSLEYDVVVTGDSMLKHIDASRLSRARKVKCHCKPGAKAEQISPAAICDSLKREGETIIHVGTNNSMEGPRSVHGKIVSVCEAVNTTGRHPCISGVIHRRWETPYERRRIETLNHHLQLTAQEKRWGFIDNSNVSDRHLVEDGVHLNKSGQATFAGNLSRYINRNQRHRSFGRQRQRADHHQQQSIQSVYEMQHRHGNQHPRQPRSYADVTSGRNSPARGPRQDFDMEFRRSRLKTSHQQQMADQNHQMQWRNYLQFVRDTTRGI